ncbi:hypothetical protein J7X11_000777 [Vibrio parahaemolyticus]|nr:hypothetical protein [Vibrio parahaemolyticus]EHR6924480.1 hypothetical protein [Vibrio parahaemolyticus]
MKKKLVSNLGILVVGPFLCYTSFSFSEELTGSGNFNVTAVVSGDVGVISADGGPLQDMEMVYVPGVGLEKSVQLIQFTSNNPKETDKIKVTLPVGAKLTNPSEPSDEVPLTVTIGGVEVTTAGVGMDSVVIDDNTHKSQQMELAVTCSNVCDSLVAGTYTGSIVLQLDQPLTM